MKTLNTIAQKLFALIEEAKNSNNYSVANLAFSCLLDIAIDTPSFKIIWESDTNNILDWEEIKNIIYYDLVVINFGSRDVCIPAPILKPGIQKACFLDAKDRNNFIQRRQHQRNPGKSLPGQEQYLIEKLNIICPNYKKLGDKYLDLSQQTCS